MILTGECLEAFKFWVLNKGFEKFNAKEYSLDIAKAMTYAVIIEFFDSVGIEECNIRNILIYFLKFYKVSEATEKAIEKANEIFNNQ